MFLSVKGYYFLSLDYVLLLKGFAISFTHWNLSQYLRSNLWYVLARITKMSQLFPRLFWICKYYLNSLFIFSLFLLIVQKFRFLRLEINKNKEYFLLVIVLDLCEFLEILRHVPNGIVILN